jgi:anti-anti-sigma regulatory factor
MSTSGHEFQLPPRVAHEDLLRLKSQLCACSGTSFVISAHAWRIFDSMTLQFILTAAREWRKRGERLVVIGLSPEMRTTIGQIGVEPDMLCWEDAQ